MVDTQGVVAIKKHSKHGEFEILIDRTDYDNLSQSGVLDGLHITKNGQNIYAKNRRGQYLHRLILSPDRGKQVDHINRNGVDNRRVNLRTVTQQENLRNQKRANNKTGVTGVSLTRSNTYSADIRLNYKKIHIGTFAKLADAIRARKDAEIRLWRVGV